MRQLMAGLVIIALGVTGCAASATTGSATPPPGLGGLTSNGPAQWVVDGTFETQSVPAQPLPGVVTFRDTANGHTVTVTVGASGQFSLGLVAGTYTATGQAGPSGSQCAPSVTFTVLAGQLTRVSLTCKAAS